MTTVASEQRVELDELVEESRERVARSLRGRDRLVTVVAASAFVAAAVPFALLASTSREPSLWIGALLVVSYAIASRVEFEIGAGSAIPTQVVFVPMLFVLPARMIPLCVALALVLGVLPDVRRSRVHFERILVQLVSSWHALGPAAVMLAAGEPEPSLGHWPVVAGAFAAQFGVDVVTSAVRTRIAYGVTLRELLAVMTSVYVVDAVLNQSVSRLPSRPPTSRPLRSSGSLSWACWPCSPERGSAGLTTRSSSAMPTVAPPSFWETWSRRTTRTRGVTAVTWSSSRLRSQVCSDSRRGTCGTPSSALSCTTSARSESRTRSSPNQVRSLPRSER